MLGHVVLYLAFCSFLYLSYASATFGIILIGIVGLVASGLKIAEWRRTWPFHPLPALLELPPPAKDESFGPTPLRPRRGQADPTYRDYRIVPSPSKTRREFAEEYLPYNAMPEFSEGTMAYLAGNNRNPYPENSVQAQAWNRGRECCGRYEDQEGRERGGRPW
jgi:hypothetical protein